MPARLRMHLDRGGGATLCGRDPGWQVTRDAERVTCQRCKRHPAFEGIALAARRAAQWGDGDSE